MKMMKLQICADTKGEYHMQILSKLYSFGLNGIVCSLNIIQGQII